MIYGTQAKGLRYATNVGGFWRTSTVTPIPTNGALLAYDPSANTLVITVPTPGIGLAVATKRAGAARFGQVRPWAPLPHASVQPTSLTSRGGRITVAALVHGVTSPSAVVATGRSASGGGQVQPIRGARVASFPLVASVNRRQLVLAWTGSGAWSSRATWDATRKAWRMTAPVRRTHSAYDQVLGVGVDGGGHSYLLVHRIAGDAPPSRP